MIEVPINYLAVLVAAIVNMALGYAWYGPLFGKEWMKLMGITEEQMKKGGNDMTKRYILMFVGTLIMSFVLAHAVIFAGSYLLLSGFWLGVMVGFMNWIGFIAPVTLSSALWEEKHWKLWIINASYYLVGMVFMGIILAVWY